MKFPPAPILALLALGGACGLAPPSSNPGRGGNAGTTTPAGGGIGGGRGGASSAITASGGNTTHRDAGATGGSSANGGASTPTSTGSTFPGGGAPAGGSTSGGTGGAAGGTATAGSATGGTTTGGFNAGGSRTATGGTTTAGGSTATGGISARGGATGGTATGGSATGGTSTSPGGTHAQPPPITSGSSGFTTRYWDCCKPSCGWSANANGKPTHTCGKDGTSTTGNDTQSACSGGGGYMCYWGAPWSVSDTLSYGFAAYNGVPCGTCFQLQFTGKGHYGNDPGSSAINGKTMIVQVINIGGISSSQFDLLIPGGGVGANNACTAGSGQWGSADIGAGSGGILTSCGSGGTSCVQQKCQAAFGDKPLLLAGCTWFTGWFKIADNPEILYQKTTCPPEITAKSGM